MVNNVASMSLIALEKFWRVPSLLRSSTLLRGNSGLNLHTCVIQGTPKNLCRQCIKVPVGIFLCRFFRLWWSNECSNLNVFGSCFDWVNHSLSEPRYPSATQSLHAYDTMPDTQRCIHFGMGRRTWDDLACVDVDISPSMRYSKWCHLERVWFVLMLIRAYLMACYDFSILLHWLNLSVLIRSSSYFTPTARARCCGPPQRWWVENAIHRLALACIICSFLLFVQICFCICRNLSISHFWSRNTLT